MNTFKYNLFNTCLHASNNNLNHFELLRNVYERGLFQSNKNKILSKMIDLTKNINNSIKSQLYQDVFALLMVGDNYDKTFLEFGATDGLELSNTYLLESEFNWKGVLCEPSPQWHEVLFKNRPKTKIVTDCIWKNSNEIEISTILKKIRISELYYVNRLLKRILLIESDPPIVVVDRKYIKKNARFQIFKKLEMKISECNFLYDSKRSSDKGP